MTQVEEPPYPSARYAIYVVFVLLLAVVMSYLDRQIITLLLPSLKADLNISDTQVSLIQGMAFASVYAFAGLPMGWIADHANRRNLLLAGIMFWTLATAACGLAENFGQLFAARMAVGLGESCLGPACASIMADYFRPSQRGRAMGVMVAGAPIGSAAALFIGGLLLSSLTHGGAAALIPQGWAPWQIIFLATASPGLLVVALVAALREPPRRRDLATNQSDKPQLRLIDFFRDHVGVAALFFSLAACTAMVAAAISGWAPTMLMRIYGTAPTQAGVIYGSIMLFCSATAGVCSGFASDALVQRWRFGGRALLPLLLLPVEFGADLTLILANSVTVTVSALAVSGFILAFIGTSYQAAIQDLFPNQLRGRAFAVFGLVSIVLGLGVGPTLVALVTDHVFRDEMMLQKSVGLVALSTTSLALLLAIALPRFYAQARRKGLAPQPPIALGAVATVSTT